MRRAAAALVATVAGVIWLVTFKVTPHARLPVSAPAPSTTPAAVAAASEGGGATPAPSRPPATPTPAPRVANGSFTGSDVPTPYGDVQVRLTVAGGRVTDVVALQMPSDRARSEEITQYVTPVLRSEAIQAQSARIDIISGATFTSEAYAESLDAALRQDHLA